MTNPRISGRSKRLGPATGSGGAPHLARAEFAFTSVPDTTATRLTFGGPTIYQDPDGVFDTANDQIVVPFDCDMILNIQTENSRSTPSLLNPGFVQIGTVTSAPEIDDAISIPVISAVDQVTTFILSTVRHFSAGDTIYFEIFANVGQTIGTSPVIGLMYWAT